MPAACDTMGKTQTELWGDSMDQSIRILVVDDEPDIRRIIRILLEGRGYHVTEAPNGRLAVQAAQQDL